MLSLRHPPRRTGFSLIELMVTLAILALLFMLAMPTFGDWTLNAQIRTAAESIQDGLQKARTEAVRRNEPVEFILGADSTWTVNFIDVMNARAHTLIEARTNAEGSSKVVVTAAPAGATTVTFDGAGRQCGDPITCKNLDPPANSAQMTRICVNLPITVLPAARSRNLEIDIDPSGGIRMCDPQVTLNTDSRYCPGSPTPCTD